MKRGLCMLYAVTVEQLLDATDWLNWYKMKFVDGYGIIEPLLALNSVLLY